MEKINHYVSIVNQAFTVAKDNLNNPESLKKAETDKEALINSLNPHCSHPLCNSLISNIRIF